MKKFKYRVESYLKFLTHQREEVLKELKIAENYRNNLLNKYSRMEDKMKNAYKENSSVGQGGHDIRYIQDNNQFLKKLKTHMEDLSTEINEAEQEYQMKYQLLMQLQKKVKQIELHKEAELEKFKKEYKKKTQKITDEINSTRQGARNAKSL